MNAYTYLTFLIIGLIVLAHLGLLYLVIRFAVTHALDTTRRHEEQEQAKAYKLRIEKQ